MVSSGRNGAGKSTTIRMLMGMVQPSSERPRYWVTTWPRCRRKFAAGSPTWRKGIRSTAG